MDSMRDSKIIGVVDALNRVMNIDSKTVQDKLKEYSTMSDKDVIKELSMIVYNQFKNNTELYEYFLSMIRNINPEIIPSVEYMKEELNKMFLNENDSSSLSDNHKLACDTFKYIADLFNREGIDYVIVGAFPCFIQKGVPLFRYHDDIDVMINEDDIEKVKVLMESSGYIFSDLRFPSIEEYHEMLKNKPPHQVMASFVDSEFHIGFFTFRRENDNSMTTTEYIQREESGEVIVDRLERSYSPEATQLNFEDTCIYDGVIARISSPEHVYHLKSCTRRPKDLTDMEVLENHIDKVKLKELRRRPSIKQIIRNVSKKNEMTM